MGTSGYDYPEWRGVFYPANLKRKDFLLYYSTVFNAVELNFSFYGMPDAKGLLSFYQRSEGRLKFSVKANRLLTHEVGINWKDAAADFRAAIEPLFKKDALCAVLFQFPQSFHYTDQNRIYLASLLAQFKGLPLVVEFRRGEWARKSVFAGLEERGASLALCDFPRLKSLPWKGLKAAASAFAGTSVYIRLHGRNQNAWYAKEDGQNPGDKNGSGRYRYDYNDDELASFVPIVQAAQNSGKVPMIFFNNHPDGSGAKNAKRLAEMLQKA